MIDFIDIVKALFVIFIICACIVLFGFLVCLIPPVNQTLKHHSAVRKEWQAKVNKCVLNSESNLNCKLILYRDKQIKAEQTDNTTVMPMPVVIAH